MKCFASMGFMLKSKATKGGIKFMYCINCGVELADSEKVCPLCGTPVYNPDIKIKEKEPPYPPYHPKDTKLKTKVVLLVVTILFAVMLTQFIICEFSIPSAEKWAGYVIGGLLLSYIVFVLPLWFRKPNPIIFVVCDHIAVLLFLLYVSYMTGGKWFLNFALPAVGALMLINTVFAVLLKYVHRGHFYIIGGMMIALGGFSVLLEFLINNAFKAQNTLQWSFFPAAAGLVIGIMFIIIAMCRPFREALEKKLFM